MYLAYLSHSVAPKNNLDRDFEEFLKKIDRTMVNDADIDEFKNMILHEYSRLGVVYKRCKPRNLYFDSSRYHKDHDQIKLEGSHVDFYLYHSAKEFTPDQ